MRVSFFMILKKSGLFTEKARVLVLSRLGKGHDVWFYYLLLLETKAYEKRYGVYIHKVLVPNTVCLEI